MKKWILILAVMVWGVSAPSLAFNNNDLEIVAVVGDDVISTLDVKERMQLMIASSGMTPSKEVNQRVFPQVLKNLIDERLYMKEADNLNIRATDEDVSTAVMRLEVKNGIKGGTFDDFLKAQGISVGTAMDQLKAQVVWNKIIMKKIRPKVMITDREMDEAMEHISKSSGMSELHISEIVLPVDAPEDKKRVRELASGLVKEIRHGASFSLVAKEFSRGSSASSGGDLGWLQEEHIQPEIMAQIRTLSAGEVSEPFENGDNYYIIRLDERRALVTEQDAESKMSIKQMLVQVTKDMPQKKVKQLAQTLAKEGEKVDCNNFTHYATKYHSLVKPNTLEVKLSELNGEVRNAIAKTPEGKLTSPILGPNGLYIFAICDKPEGNRAVVMRNKVEELLLRKKMDLQAQRYLRELRSKAFIDIRLPIPGKPEAK